MAWPQSSPESRGYGAAWRKLRAQILLRDRYLCQVSLKKGRIVAATEVDHVVSKADWLRKHGNLDGVDDPSNLQAICKAEHDRKTMIEKGHQPVMGGFANGLPRDPLHPWNNE